MSKDNAVKKDEGAFIAESQSGKGAESFRQDSKTGLTGFSRAERGETYSDSSSSARSTRLNPVNPVSESCLKETSLCDSATSRLCVKKGTGRMALSSLVWLRRIVALAVFAAFVALFAGAQWGVYAKHLAPLAKAQFVPALLAGGLVAAGLVAAATLLFGRLYCGVLCPLGLLQDVAFRLKKHGAQNTLRQPPVQTVARYSVLALFLVVGLCGLGWSWVEPYGLFGRICTSLVWAGLGVVIVALAVWKGRVWCNWVCPVGTFLGGLARHAPFAPAIDRAKCVGCRKCEKHCKAGAIAIRGRGDGAIDRSLCVDCYNCLGQCPVGAIGLGGQKKTVSTGLKQDSQDFSREERGEHEESLHDSPRSTRQNPVNQKKNPVNPVNKDSTEGLTRRSFLFGTAATAAALAAEAAEKTVDGGYADITAPGIDARNASLKPAGSHSIRNFQTKCVGCQLCVKACPNHVLRPSTRLRDFGQPEMAFDRGYCTTDCSRCSHVCPAGAIEPIPAFMKPNVHIGAAMWHPDRCLAQTEGVNCTACFRHCPVGAIQRVKTDAGILIPVVDADKCIGCGACEHVCPARPLPGMTVRAHEVHREAWPTREESALGEARHLLMKEGCSCVLVKDGVIVAKETGRGVAPLLTLLDERPDALRGAWVVDRVIGRAAAAICVKGGAARVYGVTVSEDSAAFLASHGIPCEAGATVPRILNRDRSGGCPLEVACAGLDDPDAILAALRARQ